MDTNTNEENANAPIGGKKLLIVEDDDFLSSILLSRLNNKDTTVILTGSGEGALNELKKGTPDAILLDILLPGINGFDVLKVIRADALLKDIPVTVISNFDQAKDKEMAKSMNADYLVKALVTPDDIAAKVDEMLGMSK